MSTLTNKINKTDSKYLKNKRMDHKLNIKKFSQVIKTIDQNIKLKLQQSYNQNQIDSLGLYTPYTLLDPSLAYEYIDELSFMIRNIDRKNDFNNMFKWKNILDNKIKNLLFIYSHIAILPVYPFIEKNIFDPTVEINNIRNHLIDLFNQNKLIIDQNIQIGSKTINIPYYDTDIIEFNINSDFQSLFQINIKTNQLFIFKRSQRCLTNNEFLYLDIDSNDNLNNNFQYNTSYKYHKYTFKLLPLQYTDTNIYYKSMGQHLIKTLNTLSDIDNLTIQLYDEKFQPLNNNFINQNLYDSVSLINCQCVDSNIKPSCYCNYIRHPLNPNNRIDIAFKIGLVKNEIINDIFY
jgi:hypothetical protein